MNPEIELFDQPCVPNYNMYVLPPTPSGSSTDTASSPSYSDHGEHNLSYSGYYNTQLHKLQNIDQSGVTQQDKQRDHQLYGLQNGTELYQPENSQQNDAWNQAQCRPNKDVLPCDPCPHQITYIPSDQLIQSPLTPSSNTSADDKTKKFQKKKRPRTQYLSSQIIELERAYQSSKYLTRVKKMELSQKLNIDELRIKVWYQNRRMKDKKIGCEDKLRRRRKQDEAILFSEIPRTSENVPPFIKSEKVTLDSSMSVMNHHLTNSIWAQGHQHGVAVSTSYGQYIPSSHQWNNGPYSTSIHSVGYPSTNGQYNRYQEQQYTREGPYEQFPTYQYNVPKSDANIKEEKPVFDNNLNPFGDLLLTLL